jgi:hypothetical protein
MHFGERHSQLLPFCEYEFAPGKSPVEVQPEILEIFFFRKVLLCMWSDVHIYPRIVNVTWADLDSLPFILHLYNNFCKASSLVCSFCEAMPVLISVANTALSSAKFVVVDSVEVGRSAEYSRYNCAHQDTALVYTSLTEGVLCT